MSAYAQVELRRLRRELAHTLGDVEKLADQNAALKARLAVLVIMERVLHEVRRGRRHQRRACGGPAGVAGSNSARTPLLAGVNPQDRAGGGRHCSAAAAGGARATAGGCSKGRSGSGARLPGQAAAPGYNQPPGPGEVRCCTCGEVVAHWGVRMFVAQQELAVLLMAPPHPVPLFCCPRFTPGDVAAARGTSFDDVAATLQALVQEALPHMQAVRTAATGSAAAEEAHAALSSCGQRIRVLHNLLVVHNSDSYIESCCRCDLCGGCLCWVPIFQALVCALAVLRRGVWRPGWASGTECRPCSFPPPIGRRYDNGCMCSVTVPSAHWEQVVRCKRMSMEQALLFLANCELRKARLAALAQQRAELSALLQRVTSTHLAACSEGAEGAAGSGGRRQSGRAAASASVALPRQQQQQQQQQQQADSESTDPSWNAGALEWDAEELSLLLTANMDDEKQVHLLHALVRFQNADSIFVVH